MAAGRIATIVTGTALALAALAGCSRDEASRPAAAKPIQPLKPATAAPAGPARPPEADALDTTLAAAKDYDAKAPDELKGVTAAQKQMHALVGQAVDLSHKVDAAADAEQRKALVAKFAAVRGQLDAAHNDLMLGQATFKETSGDQTTAVDAAVAQCTASPAIGAYAGCVDLTAEQALLGVNVQALAKAYDAAEASFQKDRAALAEAATTVTLAR